MYFLKLWWIDRKEKIVMLISHWWIRISRKNIPPVFHWHSVLYPKLYIQNQNQSDFGIKEIR